jgi:ADP-heptose:LPS heptosyltransferase
VISVNTSTIHIAAALRTPLIVLYALTNPQHAPWKSVGQLFPFSVLKQQMSRNAIIRFAHDKYFSDCYDPIVLPGQILEAADAILNKGQLDPIPELVLAKHAVLA